MFVLACLLGLYSYSLFLLGILGLLYQTFVIWFTVGFWGLILFWKRKECAKFFGYLKKKGKVERVSNKLIIIFLALFILQILSNGIGVLGPELGFDALWYHLTLPKLYLEQQRIFFIPGGLLYYSAMPKLAEMFYIAGLSFGNEVTVKFIHFLFGLLTCLALYKLQRKFFTPLISLIGIVVFYSNLVVAWESASAYIDLIRAFFEIMALWAFVNWWSPTQKATEDQGGRKWLMLSATMVGLAITTKLLAIGSLLIYSFLIIYFFITNKKNSRDLFISLFIYWIIALAIPLPWFIFSFIHTGNPIYPFFTTTYSVAPEALHITGFFKDTWQLFVNSPDPLSPIYIMVLPFVIIFFSRFKKEIKMISFFSFLAIILWYFTPRTGGGRFILAYLPALSLVVAAISNEIITAAKKNNRFAGNFLLIVIVIISAISIVYRTGANAKYLPVIAGKETKAHFLADHLNFAYGDFYDIDGYFHRTIKSSDIVLLYGFHNLYYVDFPFIDSSWVKKGYKFNYIAIQRGEIPATFTHWKLVYQNDKTMVKLYQPLEGTCHQKCLY